jgi:hypothetical protein
MAKGSKISPLILCGLCIVFASAGWLMRMFPVFIFVGIAPLFALTDRAAEVKDQSAWNFVELILLALTLMIFAAHFFQLEEILFAVLQAIILSLAFAGYTFGRIHLGIHLSKLVLIFYWLAAEYIFVKVAPARFIFLADVIALKQDWYRWTFHTGYLGSSFWILMCNLLIYSAVLKSRAINWFYFSLFVISIAVPLWYSFQSDTSPVTRFQMIDLYSGGTQGSYPYHSNGEYIPRTAAWISLLIVLFTLVKSKTRRK